MQKNGGALRTCETCGNEYDKTIVVEKDGKRHVFDSFECAVHALAPTCAKCGVRVVGHGVEAKGRIFCCANCAHLSGVKAAVDRVESAP